MDTYGPEAIEAGRLLFAQECRFTWGSASLSDLPPAGLPEIAFAGRSNVGKSSLVNALTGRKTLARTSHTPGRTQQLNFFDLGGLLSLVDLPGYGYAKVSKSLSQGWTDTLKGYLRGRATLRRALVLIDGRHGIKESDTEILKLLDDTAVATQVVLTKMDKVGKGERERRIPEVEAALKRHPAAFPKVMLTSSDKGEGIPELRAFLAEIAKNG
ncbi:ribosome biogenesis GTP-binding protein YihA/YsxC [Inquilinus sp. Marseille-Q2685]|uniref:ribosome biogenesis GTP-binding protein YihA/YsxC n=1 Tax=Inquilinus sp. Marseille-Q2685 TaxID=2866581 RepID=UPI001CE498A3|nr:ribosome biogenesis GTP-binding protein YihA/YsxC [Inquilinus sp. Marseille-Q2685]